jgi:hypothetical protein
MDVGKPKIAAKVTIRQSRMVESQEMEYCRVQIMNVNRILNGIETEIVGSAVD